MRITIDEKEDLDCIKEIINYFKPNIHFKFEDIIKLYEKKPNMFKSNKNIIRDEGSRMTDGQKTLEKSKIINS